MKTRLEIVGLLAVLAAATGCVESPTWGALTATGGPVASTGKISGSKQGESKAYQVLGIVAWGDASITQAARQAGISQVNTVDREALNVLGIFSVYTCKVTGD